MQSDLGSYRALKVTERTFDQFSMLPLHVASNSWFAPPVRAQFTHLMLLMLLFCVSFQVVGCCCLIHTLVTFDQILPGIMHLCYVLIQWISLVRTIITFVAIEPLFISVVNTFFMIPQCWCRMSFKLAHTTFQTLFSMFQSPMSSHILIAICQSCLKVTCVTFEFFPLVFIPYVDVKASSKSIFSIALSSWVTYHLVFCSIMPIEV